MTEKKSDPVSGFLVLDTNSALSVMVLAALAFLFIARIQGFHDLLPD